MQEIRKFAKDMLSMDIAELKETLPAALDKIREVGFVKLVKDKEAKELIPNIREKIKTMESQDLESLMPLVFPIMLEGMTELINASGDAKDELEDIEDLTINIVVPDFMTLAIVIQDCAFTAQTTPGAEPDLTIEMDKEAWFKLVRGEADPISSYMAGDLHMIGEMTKAMQLRGLFDILSDEYDFDIGGFAGM